MKKRVILALGLALLMSSCGTPASSENSSSSVDTPTSIEVIGAKTVEVGKSIVLACDVIGTKNDVVTYSSSDKSIATVDENGTVTGVSIGTCTITIASVLDPNIKTDYSIEVIGTRSKELSLAILGENDFPYDKESGTYTIPLGQVFYVTYKLADGSSKPNNVAFSLILPSSADSTIASLTQIDDEKAKVETFGKIDGLVIKVTISYAADGSDALSNAATFNVADANEINMMKVKERLEGTTSFESSSLTSVDYSKERSDTSDATKSVTNIEFNSFTNATYSKVTKENYENDSLTTSSTTKYYSGVDSNRGKAYYFSYNIAGVKDVIINQDASSSDTKNASLISITSGGLPTFGIANIIENSALYNGTIADDIYGLSYIYLYSNSKFTISDTAITINSSYDDVDNGLKYNVSCEMGFDLGKITSYSFIETVDDGKDTVTFKESFTNFVYGDKKYDNSTNNSSFLDITKYYMTDYTLTNMAGIREENGAYDFTNLDKYGPDSVEEINGVTTYTLSYDKTLMLGVTPTAPNTASTLIDVLDCKSSDTDAIPNPSHLGNNIYVISAKEDSYGNAQTGEADLTFKSVKGIEKKIHVKFTKPELRGILVTGITNNDLGEIFQDDSTNYFYLNAIPDEDIYSYELDMVSGDASGVTLYRNSYDNLNGYPGFSYCIKGNKVGSYEFKFKITGTDFESDTYKLTVKEEYSKEYLIEQLVTSKKIFQYAPGGTIKFTLNFEDESTLRLTQYNLFDGTSLTRDINVTFEKGKILVNEEQNIYEEGGSFFYSIHDGKIAFNESLTEIYPYFDIYEEAVDGGTGHYAKYTFIEKVDTATLDTYIKGKSMTATTYIANYGLIKVIITFDAIEDSASLVLYKPDGSTLGTITFNYSYSASNTTFSLDLIKASNNVVMIQEPSISFIEDRSTYRLKIAIDGTNYVFDFSII